MCKTTDGDIKNFTKIKIEQIQTNLKHFAQILDDEKDADKIAEINSDIEFLDIFRKNF